jgi:hypothetical protein
MHIPPVEENCKEGWKAVKPMVIEDYTTHMGYDDFSDRTPNSYSMSRRTWK